MCNNNNNNHKNLCKGVTTASGCEEFLFKRHTQFLVTVAVVILLNCKCATWWSVSNSLDHTDHAVAGSVGFGIGISWKVKDKSCDALTRPLLTKGLNLTPPRHSTGDMEALLLAVVG